MGFLDRVVASLAAYGGAIWIVADSGALELAYKVDWGLPRLAVIQRNLPWHRTLLQDTMTSGKPCIIEPSKRDVDAEKPDVSTRVLLLLAPLVIDGAAKGVVEIFQRAGAPYMAQRGYVKFLTQMCELACDFLKSR